MHSQVRIDARSFPFGIVLDDYSLGYWLLGVALGYMKDSLLFGCFFFVYLSYLTFFMDKSVNMTKKRS